MKFRKILQKIVLCSAIFAHSLTVWSQTEIGNYNFSYYGSNEGLPQEDVLSLFQDNKGYIWFGTYSGTSCYNGKNYQVYNTTNGLAGNSTFDIAQDKNGIIYFATNNGISVLNNDSLYTIFNGHAFNYVFVDNANRKWFYGDKSYEFLTDDEKYVEIKDVLGKNFGHIYSVTQHSDSSSVYIATDNGLFCLSINNKCIRINTSSEIQYLYADNDSYLWLATRNQLYRMPLSEVRPRMTFSNEYLYPFLKQSVKKITQAVDGNIWGITSGFAFLIKSFTERPEIFDRTNGLAGYTVYSLLCDYENNIWIGMVGGAQKLRDKAVRRIAPVELNGYVTSIHEDRKGRIWFAMDHMIYYIHNNQVVNFSKQLFSDNAEIQSISTTKLSDGNILIVYPFGIKVVDFNTLSTVYTHSFKEPVEYVECVFVSSKNEIFISDSYNNILYYMRSYRSPLEKIESDEASGVYMFGEYKGQILATNETGLCVFNGDSFEQLLELDHSAWCLYVLGDDLWVGTEEGLGLYCTDSLKFIIESTVNSITHGRDADHLWLGMSDGIYHVDIHDGSMEIAITAKTGLPHGEISIGALMTDSNDLLWTGSFHGIAVFDYNKMPKFFTPPRNDLVIRQNGVKVSSIDSHAIKAFYHSIHFEMIALSFIYETDNVFEYVLEGNHIDNLPMTKKESVAQYNNLPPGNYTFKFRSKSATGIWSDYTSMSFFVPKPIQMQWWFYTVCLLALCTLIYFLMRLYAKILKEKNAQLEQIINERTEFIQAQNEELSAQNEELSETYSALQLVNEELDKYKTQLEGMVEAKTTELIAQKEELEKLNCHQEVFIKIMQILQLEEDVSKGMNMVLDIIGEYSQVNRVQIWENNTDGKTYGCSYEWCGEGVEPNIHLRQNLPMQYAQPWLDLLLAENVICTSNIYTLSPGIHKMLERDGVKSILVLPLSIYGSHFGFIAFHVCDFSKEWDENEVELLTNITQVFSNVIRRRQVETAMNLSQQTMRTVLDNINAQILVSEFDSYKILYANNNFMQEAGEDVVGRLCWKSRKVDAPCEHCQRSVLCDKNTLSTGVHHQEYYNPINKRWHIIMSTAIKWVNGQLAIMELTTDITDRKLSEIELIRAREKAEESDRLKSSFLANMSHEIRTPMNGIVGFLNHIENKDLPQEKVKEYYKIIQNNVQRLLKLINDILDISKLEVKQLNISKTRCNLNDLMHELYVFYDETILNNTTKKLAIILDNNESIPDFNILTDSNRLRQILTNLIDNAIKFTKAGFIEFGYRLEGEHIQFHVSDTGIGMDKEQVRVIFDRFRQADDTISSKFGGTGLGLAISRELSILLGGDMWAESDKSNGSTFYFTILCEKVEI